MTINKSWVRL